MLKSHGFKDPEVKLGSIGRSLPVQVIAVETADYFLLSISNLCLIFLQAFLISIFSVLASKKGESKTPEAHQGSCFHLALLLNFQPIYMEYFYSGLGGKLVPLMMEWLKAQGSCLAAQSKLPLLFQLFNEALFKHFDPVIQVFGIQGIADNMTILGSLLAVFSLMCYSKNCTFCSGPLVMANTACQFAY